MLNFYDFYEMNKDTISDADMDAAYTEYRENYLYSEATKYDSEDWKKCPAQAGHFSVCVYNVVTNNSSIFVTTLYRILYTLNLLKL